MDKFEWSPAPGAQSPAAPRVKEVKFGDGYAQRAPDGINTDLRTHSLTFVDTVENIGEIDAFLTAKRGVTAFLYQPFGQWVDKKVVCKQWTPEMHNTYAKLTATFEEVVA